MDKCIGCGACAEKCPKKVIDSYNMGLSKRKAAYVEYAQAVPLKYAIRDDACIYLTKNKCGNCEKLCPTGAINYEDKPEEATLKVGSVILAPGFSPFDPSKFDAYNYANHPNVITSMEIERILSPPRAPPWATWSGLSDHKEPKKIAWFQCVGSRDLNRCDNAYCSSVCCMYAIKEAVIAKEHAGDDLECAIFYHGHAHPRQRLRTLLRKRQAEGCSLRTKPGAYHRSRYRAPTILSIRYVNEDGEMHTEIFDMVVLSVGLETSPEVIGLAESSWVSNCTGQLLQDQTPLTGEHQSCWHLRLRCFPGPQRHPPVGRGCQCGGCRCRRISEFGEKHPDPNGGSDSRNQCDR